MQFKFFGFVVTVEEKPVDWYNPNNWPSKHKRQALKLAKKESNVESAVKVIRNYGLAKFGNLPQVGYCRSFVEKSRKD